MPMPAWPPRRRAVHLAEALEDVRQLALRDADAVVLDADEVTLGLALDAHHDAPVLRRELDRVGEQVPQDLLEPQGVGAHRGHRLGQGREQQPDAARLGHQPDRLDRALDHLRERDGLQVQRERPALEPGDVEQVVDEGEQDSRRLPDLPDAATQRLLVERLLFLEEIRPSHDRRQRRAQLVVHVLQEVVLEPAGAAQLVHRPHERRVQPRVAQQQRGEVREGGHRVDLLLAEPAGPVDRDGDAERLLLRLERDEHAVLGADQLLDLAVAVRVLGQVVGAIGLAGSKDHARDRTRVHRDLEPRGDVLGQVPGRQRGLEPVRVRIVEVKPDALGIGERGDGLGRAPEDLLEIRHAVGQPRELVQPAQRLDAALDALAHRVDGRGQAPDLVRRSCRVAIA